MKRMIRQSIGIFSSIVVALSPALTPLALAEGISGTGPNGPEVLRSGNDTPLIMIETPNGAGVSHNTYDSFDIDGRGAILNNIDSNYGQTQLGGYVQGNSNLRGGPASLIINEVVADNPSELGGYLEVGGARADVVVANPYGITCDSCGFINTDHATLTTGTPQFGANGALDSIDVSRGHVAIGERGLDATGVSQFDLLSRTVSFAGAIHGQNVRVVAGRNNVIYATGAVEVKGDDGGEAPAIAIDSTVLGGMYADKITIMSSERGAGVRAPETMASNAGEMHITADGRLVMGQASAQKLTVKSRQSDVEIRQQIYAAEQAEIAAARDLVIAANGQLVSEAALSLSAGRDMVMGDGAVAGSRGAHVQAEIGGDLTMGRSAQLVAAGEIGLQAGGLALGRNALISAGADIDATLSGAGALAQGAVMVSGGALSLDGTGLELVEDAVVSSGAAADVTLDQLALNGGILQAAGDLTLDSRTVTIAGGTIQSDGALGLTTGSLTGQDHVLAASDSLSLTAGTIDLGAGRIVAGSDAELRADRLAIGGTIASRDGNLRITATRGDLDATSMLAAAGDIALESKGVMRLGHVQAGAALDIAAAGDVTGLDAFEAGGMMEIVTGGSLRGLALHAGVDVVARAAGDILIGDDPETAGTLLPHEETGTPDDDGDSSGDGDPEPNPDDDGATVPPSLTDDDTGGDDDFTITPGLLIGDVRAGRDIDMSAGGRIVIGHSAVAERDIRLDAGELIDVTAVQLGGELALQSGTGEIRIGTLVLAGDFTLETEGALSLDAISAPGSLSLWADSLTLGGVAAGSDIALTADEGDLAVTGDILSGGAITLDVKGAVSAEKIVANAAIDVTSGAGLTAETVQSGERIAIETEGDLTINGPALAEQGVTLISGGQLSSGAVQALDGAVTLASTGAANIAGAVISGTATDIRAGGDLSLQALQSGGALAIHAAGDALFNADIRSADTILADIGRSLTLAAAADADAGVALIGETDITVSAARLQLGDHAQIASRTGDVALEVAGTTELGRQASLVSTEALRLSAESLRMGRGSAAQGRKTDLALAGDLALGQNTQLVGTEQLALNAHDLTLGSQALISQQGAGPMAVALTGDLTSNGGVIQSAGGLDLMAGMIALTSSDISGTAALLAETGLNLSAGDLHLNGASVIQGRRLDLALSGDAHLGDGAQIIGGRSLQLSARNLTLGTDTLIAQQGAGVMGIDVAQALASTGGIVQSAGGLDLSAGRVTLSSSDQLGTAALLAGSALTLSADTLRLTGASAIQGDTVHLNATDRTELGASAQIIGGSELQLVTGALDLGAQALIAQQGTGVMSVAATDALTSTGGMIQSAGSLDITAGTIALTSSGEFGVAALLADTDLDLRAGVLNLTGASAIQADTVALNVADAVALGAAAQVIGRESLTLTARDLGLEAGAVLGQQGSGVMSLTLAGNLISHDGIIQSAGSLDVSAAGIALASSASGTAALLAEDALDISAGTLRMTGASAVQGRAVNMVLSGNAELGAQAQIIGAETFSLQAQDLTLGAGALIAQQGTGVMTLDLAGNLTGTDAVIQSAGGLDLSAGQITLSSETATAALLAETVLEVSADALRLAGASANQGNAVNLDLTGDAVLGDGAQVIGRETLQLAARDLALGSQALISQQGTDRMSIDLTGALTSNGGIIQSAGSLDVAAASVSLTSPSETARAALLAEDGLTLRTASVTSDTASLVQSNNGNLTLRGQNGALEISGGNWRASGDADASAGRVSISEADFGAGGDLRVDAGTGDLSFDGSVSAATIAMQAAGDATLAGRFVSPGAITFAAAGDLTHAGRITTPGTLTLSAGDLLTDMGRGELPGDASENTAQLGGLNMTGGEIAATGSYLVAGDVGMAATAGGIRNSGRITSGSILKVLATGAMINMGALEAAGLEIEAARVENHGELTSGQSLNIAATGEIANAGTIASGGSLDLNAGGMVDNRVGGEIAAHDGITRISALDMRNAGTIGLVDARFDLAGDLRNSGMLSANTSGEIGGSLINAATGRIQGGSHDLNIGALENNGAFTTTGSIALALNGGDVTNRGTLHAGPLLEIGDAGAIRNAEGAELSATRIGLEGQSLANAGEIIADENYRIVMTGQIRNTGTGLIQNGTAATGTGDVIASRLTGAEIVNAGEIVNDQGALIVTANSSLSNSGKFSALGQDSYLALHADSLPDLGRIASEGTLELANADGGLLTELVTEQGDEIVTEGVLIIKSARIENAGAIAGLGGLALEGNRLINTGLLYSGGDIALRFRDLIDNDGGLILAQDNLLVAGRGTTSDGNPDELTRLINRHGGVIQTVNGDMAFHTGTLENLREFTTTTVQGFNDYPDGAVNNNRGTWSFCADVGVDCSNSRNQADGEPIDNDQLRIQSSTVSIDFQDAQPAQILSGGDISFTGGDLLNQYSLISAAGDIGFDVDNVTNMGTETGERLRFRFTFDSNAGSGRDLPAYIRAFGYTGSEFTGDGTEESRDPAWYDPAGGGLGVVTDPEHGINYEGYPTDVQIWFQGNELVLAHAEYGILDLREFSGFTSDTRDGSTDVGYVEGRFSFPARGDWGDFNSEWGFVDPGYAFGTIHAGGTISGDVSGFLTNGAVAGGQIHRPGDRDEDFAVLAATNAREASIGGALIGGDKMVTASMLSFTPDAAGMDRENASGGEITAHDGRDLDSTEIAGLDGRSGADITGGNGTGAGWREGAEVSGRAGGDASVETGLELGDGGGAGPGEITGPGGPDDVALPGRAGVDLGAIGNDNLFVVNQDPSSDYLVESRYEFIDQDSFLSSNYFLDSLGFDPEGTQRRLGDAMVETWLIRDQIFELTGRNLLTGQGSEYEQLRAMYDNAAAQAEALGLVPGVSLTADQVAALTSDIVWLEERVVSGQRVLVPQVYLTEETIRENTHGGAQIVGDAGINLNTGGLVNVGGAIGSTGGQTVIASTGDIRNDAGLIFGGGNGAADPETGLALPSVVLSADGDYLSTSGLVTGDDIVISARDILIETGATRLETAAGFADIAGPAAGIRAKGDIGLNAIRDISLAGVELAAGRDVTAIAGGDLSLGTVRLDAELGDTEGDNYDYLRTTRHLTTDITAGGDISLISTGAAPGADGLAHVTLAGSDLKAGGTIGIAAAKGDVELLSVADEFYSDRARSSSSAFGLNAKSSRDRVYDLSQNTVSLAGNEIDISAERDVIAEGTGFTAGGRSGQDAVDSGDLRITAETGNIDFGAVESIHAEKHEESSKILGGLFSSSSTTEDVLSDMEGVTVTTTGDLDLSAVDGSVLLQGGDLQIGGDLITRTDQVYLQGIIDTEYSFAHSNDNNGFVITDRTEVSLAETADAPRITTGGRNGLLDPIGPAIHLGGRGDETSGSDQLTRGGLIEALGPQGILPMVGGETGDGTGDGGAGGEHWTASLKDQYGDDAELTLTALTDVTGPGTGYLRELGADTSGRVTYGDEVELLDVQYEEVTRQAGVLTKALIAVATYGQGAWATFATNTAVDGVISGELDLENIVKDAAFTAVTAGFNLGEGAQFGGLDSAIDRLKLSDAGLFNTGTLSQEWLVTGLADGAVQTALYGGEFTDHVLGSLGDRAINDLLALSQGKVGDLKSGEGSLDGALMHGLAGCAAAVAGDQDCAAGFVAAAGAELATGALDRQNGGDMLATSEAMKHYVNPILAALTSGGDVGQYSTNLGVQSSQLANNYLSHAENTRRINAEQALKACNDSSNCSAEQVAELTETVAYWDQVDAERDAALTGACTADRNGSDCRDLVRDALIAQDRLPGDFILNAGNGYAEAPIRYGEYGAENSGDPRLDAVAARERAHIVEYNSTENVLAPYEDIARSIARDQGLALIIGGGMTLAVPGGGGGKPAGGGTVAA
ncbi:filamentous hemagglutinin N-terminal domain-containing protein, partial [Paracoccus onubensis]|uniref:two-partner secretion domain-containing protein n=1 Tax=Paracoccus onubensis TaxID=1675788 RepID=UPI00273168E6